MARITTILGIALIVLGVAFYLGTGRVSITALIPTFLGVLILVLALAGFSTNEKVRMHAMHAASLLAILGLLGTVGGVVRLARMAAGLHVVRPIAAVEASIMAMLCAVFVALSIHSFISIRRRRAASRG
jgi:hypothetical protein